MEWELKEMKEMAVRLLDGWAVKWLGFCFWDLGFFCSCAKVIRNEVRYRIPPYKTRDQRAESQEVFPVPEPNLVALHDKNLIPRGDFDLAWLEWDEMYATVMKK